MRIQDVERSDSNELWAPRRAWRQLRSLVGMRVRWACGSLKHAVLREPGSQRPINGWDMDAAQLLITQELFEEALARAPEADHKREAWGVWVDAWLDERDWGELVSAALAACRLTGVTRGGVVFTGVKEPKPAWKPEWKAKFPPGTFKGRR